MKIGILQTGHAPDEVQDQLGDYDAMFGRLLADEGFVFETFNVVDMAFPQSVTACDGWLVTGSKHGAYEDHAFIPPLEVFIRAARDNDVPMVGICFGHQIIAQFGDTMIDGLAKLRGVGVVPDPLLARVQDNLGKPNANQKLAAMIAQFFRERRIA